MMEVRLNRPISAFLFDFDGVIVDSAPIRIDGFRAIFRDQPAKLVERLIEYHVANGGISRYAKIRWFYETLLGRPCPEEEGAARATEFKEIMLERMIDPELIISETLEFIQFLRDRVPLHIVSGSDGVELRQICESIGIASLFDSIEGSPKPKDILVQELVLERGYNPAHTILIGDAINDRDAAKASGLTFCGYNNEVLRTFSDVYIDNFSDFARLI